MHRTCTQPWLEGRSTDLESLLSGSGLDRPARELCYLVLASVDRQVKQLAGRPTGHSGPVLDSNGYILEPYKKEFSWPVLDKILEKF